MMRIQLTQNKYALIDDEDYLLVNQYKWYAMRTGRQWVVATGPNKKTNGKQLLMHRLIMNAQSGQEVDHKEHYEDYIDNQRSNLRLCIHAENGRNQRKHNHRAGKKTSSQYKGVYWHKKAGKWLARITLNYKIIHLGYFTDEIEAALAYNAAAIEHFGEFAKLNDV